MKLYFVINFGRYENIEFQLGVIYYKFIYSNYSVQELKVLKVLFYIIMYNNSIDKLYQI